MISPRTSLLLSVVVLAMGAVTASAQVVPANKRAASLEAAQNLIAARDTALPANLADPFHPAGFGNSPVTPNVQPGGGETPTTEPVVRSGPRTDRELIAAIAAAIKPSGNFVIGGQPTLVFGQKRVKAGDPLTINFEGTEYTLTITAIDRTSFTLRLNREEYTRPIK